MITLERVGVCSCADVGRMEVHGGRRECGWIPPAGVLTPSITASASRHSSSGASWRRRARG